MQSPDSPISFDSLEEIGEENWNTLASSLDGTVYHHSAWHRAIELTYGIRPVYIVKRGAGGRISSAMPAARLDWKLGKSRLVSYPFSDVCGPLYGTREEADGFIAALARFGTEGLQTEIRSTVRFTPDCFSAYGGYAVYTLRIDRDEGALMEGFHRDCVRRKIKKAFQNGLRAREGNTVADLREFYGLHIRSRKRQGAPVQPFSFFRNIWNELYTRNLASLILVDKGPSAVSGVLLLQLGDTAYYKFGASDERHFGSGASQLAIWTAIKKASHEGRRVFDFGRTFTGNRGLMEFKMRWGAEAFPLYYLHAPGGKVVLKDEGGKAARAAGALFRILPGFSNRLLGRLFYRYLA
ncbi:MAG: GNAT family N-acetyltransferase [Deltaproteobacteria bacterium]|nr:GNAT family N-acetyltransferase [Deltaproteobacteria bacterium]MBZ0219150.1 GNAT family N-acetyltransferase [Deltaproteobacteria bacterium]